MSQGQPPGTISRLPPTELSPQSIQLYVGGEFRSSKDRKNLLRRKLRRRGRSVVGFPIEMSVDFPLWEPGSAAHPGLAVHPQSIEILEQRASFPISLARRRWSLAALKQLTPSTVLLSKTHTHPSLVGQANDRSRTCPWRPVVMVRVPHLVVLTFWRTLDRMLMGLFRHRGN